MGEGPSEIVVRFRDFPFACNIKESAHANDSIAKEALGFMPCTLPITLQAIIEQSSGIADVSSKIGDRSANRCRHKKPVGSADGPHKVRHNSAVKLPNDTVRGLQRISEWAGEDDFALGLAYRC